jgi:hypothetical protein
MDSVLQEALAIAAVIVALELRALGRRAGASSRRPSAAPDAASE